MGEGENNSEGCLRSPDQLARLIMISRRLGSFGSRASNSSLLGATESQDRILPSVEGDGTSASSGIEEVIVVI